MSDASSNARMRIGFPVVTVPELGRCAVIFSFGHPGDLTAFATVFDSRGRVFQQVPVSLLALREATAKPVTFVEAPDVASAPVSGLVGSNGQAL